MLYLTFIFRFILCILFITGQLCFAQKAGDVDPSFISNAILGSGEIMTYTIYEGKIILARKRPTGAEIVRYTLEGKIDLSFKPTFLNYIFGSITSEVKVYQITVLSNKKIAVAADHIYGNVKNTGGFILLNQDGSIDSTYNYTGTGSPKNFAELSNGGLYFTSYSYSNVSWVDKVEPNGHLDPNFQQVKFDEPINRIIAQKSGKALVFGPFKQVVHQGVGFKMNNYGRLLTNGLVDTSLYQSSAINGWRFIQELPDETLIGIASFAPVTATSPIYLFKFDKDMHLLSSVALEGLNAENVLSVNRMKEGDLYIQKVLEHNSNGYTTEFVKVNVNGQTDPTFHFATKGTYTDIFYPDLTGLYTYGYNAVPFGISEYYFYRFDQSGNKDLSFSFDLAKPSNNALVLKNGKILYLGSANTDIKERIKLKNPDGKPDLLFQPDSLFHPFSTINTMIETDNGNILLGGQLYNPDNSENNYLVGYKQNGNIDTSYRSNSFNGGAVNNIFEMANQKLLVAGFFSSYGTTTLRSLALLDKKGNLDQTFYNEFKNTNIRFSDASKSPLGDVYIADAYIPTTIYVINPQGSLKKSFKFNTQLFDCYVAKFKFNSKNEIVTILTYKENNQEKQSVFLFNESGQLKSSFSCPLTFNKAGFGWKSLLLEILDDDRMLLHNPNDFTTFLINRDGTVDSSFTIDYLDINQAKFITKYDSKRVLIGYMKQGSKLNSENFIVNRLSVFPEIVLGNQAAIEWSGAELINNIYPNPATDEITVSKPEDGRFQLYTSLGVTHLKLNFKSGQQKISLSGIPNGIYLYEIYSAENILSSKGKLIINH
ncbi:MAG: T9SS type A sorting domain-containing protein [Opitutaceae bacterium]|nr:T9SS type A sorting domain-containing protein [Cytophagales bacterium]